MNGHFKICLGSLKIDMMRAPGSLYSLYKKCQPRAMCWQSGAMRKARVAVGLILTHCGLVMPCGNTDLAGVKIGPGNGLLPDGAKPLPETMLTNHQWGLVASFLQQFHRRCLISILDINLKFTTIIQDCRGQWVTCWFLLIVLNIPYELAFMRSRNFHGSLIQFLFLLFSG